MFNVYFYEVFEEEADALRRFLPSTITYAMTSATIQESGHTEPLAKLISIRTQSCIPLSWASRLDGILSRSTGYDHIIQYRQNIDVPLPCGYLEEYATRAVAEHALLLMMALMKKLPQQMKQFYTFHRDGITGIECAHRNLLVVGVGRIGSEIVRLGHALGMEVKGVDIVKKYNFVQYTSKDDGIPWADVIICAMNLTSENIGYFSYPVLKTAKRGAFFINIARGEFAPLPDLVQLLEEGHLGGVGLDVFEDEPQLASLMRTQSHQSSPIVQGVHRLLQFPNVLLTPHNAFNTQEAVERKAQYTTDQIIYFLKHKKFRWQV
ncbi:MAG: hydroxyacid dehydrogenase [Bacteroidetes bacterium]|nr:hydroxyacid dehydrogenase [Bacteroidota bacterium]